MTRWTSAREQSEFEWIRDEFAHDYNKTHFVRTEAFHDAFADMPDRDMFIEFLERSCTAEFSGCLLYTEMYKKLHNPTLAAIFRSMSRDEGRHAGFLNKTMADLDVRLDLNVLRSRKKYTHFKPKFIFYATYLSEKIGYARYILILPPPSAAPRGADSPDLRLVRGVVQRRVPPRRVFRHHDAQPARPAPWRQCLLDSLLSLGSLT